jgi:hypothetical protein
MKMLTVMALIGLLGAMYPRIMRSESRVMIQIIYRAAGIEMYAR